MESLCNQNPLGPGRVAAPEQSSGQELGRHSPSHAPGLLLTQLWGAREALLPGMPV